MSRRIFWWMIAILAVLRLTLMATTPVFDPSEARYAAISANMARSGDFVVPHFTHNGRYQSFDGKPPLVFQAGGVFCRAFGVCPFAVRLFPFLSAALLLVLVHHATRRFSGAEDARLAAAVTATSAAFFAAAGLSMTDMTLACCVSGALLMYRCFLERYALGYAAAVAALLGAGMIVKGPVAIVMFGLPLLADAVVNRRWKGIFNIRWLAVAPVFLAVAVPWFVLVEQRNPGSVWYFFYNENFLRFVSHDYGDKYGAGREAFRGVSVVWTLVATLPWSLVPFWRWFRGRVKPGGLGEFPLVAVLAITGFWCLTSRVLLYYLFPVIPLFAVWLVTKGDRRLLARLVPWSAAIAVVVAVALPVSGMLFSDKMKGAASPQYFGYCNRYSHEFYHGTAPEAYGDGVTPEFVMKRALKTLEKAK